MASPSYQVYELLETEEGRDRAFSKLDTIKSSVVWWEAGAQPPQMLADGEVAMTSAYNGRLFNAIVKEKKPFVIVWDGQIWALDVWGIPKGTPNLQEALSSSSTPLPRRPWRSKRGGSPTVPRASRPVPMISTHAETGEPMAGHMPTAPENFKTALGTNTHSGPTTRMS